MAEFVDLILDNGELVRVECPDKFVDEMYEGIENAMKRGDWWHPDSHRCTATYLGRPIRSVSMRRVVGMLS